jgi:hypothetical protein
VRTTVALVNTPDDASSAGSGWRRIGDLPSPAGCNNTQVLIGALDQLRRWEKAMGAWLRRQWSWLVVERVPRRRHKANTKVESVAYANADRT